MENLAKKRMTVQEYFTYEESSREKHEFYRGELYAMSGATRIHNLVVGNLLYLFKSQLKNKNCEIYTSDMRVQIHAQNHYTYPDLTIVCGKRLFTDSKETTLLNPSLILEVLSESTESYDRGKKFQSYRSIPSLQTYLLVSTNEQQIEEFRKTEDNLWTLSEPNTVGIMLTHFPECFLKIEEVYSGIDLDVG